MKKGDLIRGNGLLLYILISFIDRFCFKIDDSLYIPLAILSIILLIIGFIKNKKRK